MNRASLFIIVSLAFLVGAPSSTFAITDTALEKESTSDAAMSSCKDGTYSCGCKSSTATVSSQASSVVSSATTCDEFCNKSHGSSFALTCTYGDGTTNHSVAEGNVGSTKITGETPVTEKKEADFIVPVLNVKIPGLSPFETPTKIGDIISVNFLAQYVNALYKWALGAAALIAVVMMMLGGLQYVLSRGKAKYIEKAKKRITNAITGLVLLFSAYVLANLIDPRLVALKSLNVRGVDYLALTQDSGDTSGTDGAFPTLTNVPENLTCDPDESLFDIATSTLGHVTYRMGGKFGKPGPYSDKATKVDPQGRQYRTYCPEGQLCLDCSGYASFIAQCAGLPSAGESGGTKGIFANATKITSYTDTSVNGKSLIPGDMIGWPTTEDGTGHVVTYIGNGKIAESHGGSGRKPGMAASVSATSTFISSITASGTTLYIRHR